MFLLYLPVSTYKVVKFMVNVRLMEKRVKSHVGSVMVVNVTIQYKRPGSTMRTVRITRPSRPNVDGEAASAALMAEMEACSASVAFSRAGTALLAADDAALAASMVVRVWK